MQSVIRILECDTLLCVPFSTPHFPYLTRITADLSLSPILSSLHTPYPQFLARHKAIIAMCTAWMLRLLF